MKTAEEAAREMAESLSKKYKAELLVATSPFSNIRLFVEGTSKEIIEINDKLLARYEKKQV